MRPFLRDVNCPLLKGLVHAVCTELIEQPLVLSLLTVSHEQKRPANPKKEIGIYLTSGADQLGGFVDAQE
jgi:hypothetical protein